MKKKKYHEKNFAFLEFRRLIFIEFSVLKNFEFFDDWKNCVVLF